MQSDSLRSSDALILFPWNEKYSLGIDFVDRQHRKLVDIINQLHAAMLVGKGAETIEKIFLDLERYSGTHFGDEEKMLAQRGYPDLEDHKAAHRKFIERIAELRERAMVNAFVANQVLMYLKNWLSMHILGTDRQYLDHLKETGGV